MDFSAAKDTAKHTKASVGLWGETLVARWLQQQHWELLHQRWRCRWGELDLIALSPARSHLIFVEVKTRSARNLDSGGRLAVGDRKQQKLWQAAELFLAEHPQWSELPCRFDVAIVARVGQPHPVPSEVPEVSIQLGQPVAMGGLWLVLEEYLEAAFTLE